MLTHLRVATKTAKCLAKGSSKHVQINRGLVAVRTNVLNSVVIQNQFTAARRGKIALPDGAGKVFCLGLNKTGTTTMEAALRELGYDMGSQRRGEKLLQHWLARDFASILAFARTADAFQDIPFSLPFTYQALDMAFPQAKFILTVRSSADEWYDSMVRFTVEFFGLNRLPTAAELRASSYRYPGYMYDAQCGTVPGTDRDPFDRDAHLRFYKTHIYNVRAYFRNSPRLAVINVAQPASYRALCGFLGRRPMRETFEHLNASASTVAEVA